MAKFVYDKEHLRFNRKETSVWDVVWTIAKYVLLTLISSVVIYLFFALIFDTDKERALSQENKALKEEYERLSEQLALAGNVIENLEIKDREIYNDVFNADPPKYNLSSADSSNVDLGDIYSETESDLIWDAYASLKRLEFRTKQVDGWISSIESHFTSPDADPTSLPSVVPVKNFSVVQTGASVGKKVNPFLKSVKDHNGIDLMSPSGTEVICAADGQVSKVEKLGKGSGNRVEVTHSGGYVTTYSHLSDIIVRNGQIVSQGTVIGRVGSSGTTFAPCLHYEVIRNGEYQDPINYFFSDLTALQYNEMMIVAMTTGQSMD